MVRTLKEAIILSRLNEKPSTKEEIIISMNIGKSNIDRSIRDMKRSGLVKGRGYYFLTTKGKNHFNNACRKINGKI